MAVFAFTDARFYVGSYDLSGRTNDIQLKTAVKQLDTTNFRSAGWQESIGGIKTVTGSAKGQQDEALTGPDNLLGVGPLGTFPVTIAPSTAIVGDLAYLGDLLVRSYTPVAAKSGDLANWAVDLDGAYGLARGAVLSAEPAVQVAGWTGTGVLIGAVGAAQKLGIAIHVLSYVGAGALTVVVESAVTNFATITTRYTSSAIAAVGSVWATVAGPITDTFFRVKPTFTGTSVVAVVSVGILP